MEVEIESTWKNILKSEFTKEYFIELVKKLKEEYRNYKIYPRGNQLFKAFELCPFPSLKVVILGQDPYHNPMQAHGLCFSVPDNVNMPPSLLNIIKEIKADIGQSKLNSGNLTSWGMQGVLLLNTFLTVRANQPASHRELGWHHFTNMVIKSISKKKEKVVFLLWGSYAKLKSSLIDCSKHLVLTAPHPSPLSAYRGFFGCKHFSKTNNYLIKNKRPPIEW